MYDIVFISYNGPNADENWAALNGAQLVQINLMESMP